MSDLLNYKATRDTIIACMCRAALAGGRDALSHRHNITTIGYAERAVEAAILAVLRADTYAIPIVSEEDPASQLSTVTAGPRFLVDPIDASNEFATGGPEFAICIGLITESGPLAGVILAPALGHLFRADVAAGLAEEVILSEDLETIQECRRMDLQRPARATKRLIAVIGKDALNDEMVAYLQARDVAEIGFLNSALKFCHVARGDADIFPRLAPSREWDVAAGHALVAAVGGRVVDLSDRPLLYGKPGLINPHFVAERVLLREKFAHER